MTQFRRYRRINGFSCPCHPFQFLAWGIVLYFSIFFFLTIIPQINLPMQIIFGSIFGAAMSSHCILHFIATLLDPADTTLRNKQKLDGIKPVPELDRQKHKHVIENYFCNLCEIRITNDETKHCSTCNKCIENFDHHCKWLNNCVGGRNYRLFIWTLITALIGLAILIVLSIGVIIAYFTDVKQGLVLKPYRDFYDTLSVKNVSLSVLNTQNLQGTGLFHVIFIKTSDLAFLIINVFTITLSIAALALLCQLLDFHVYLYKNGLSTYDYIMGARGPKLKKPQPDVVDKASSHTEANGTESPHQDDILSPVSDSGKKSAFKRRQNKVVPSQHNVHWQDEQNSHCGPSPSDLLSARYSSDHETQAEDINSSPLHPDIHTRKKPFSLEPLSTQPTYNQLVSDQDYSKKRKRMKRRHRPLPQLPPLISIATVSQSNTLPTIPDGQELPLSSARSDVSYRPVEVHYSPRPPYGALTTSFQNTQLETVRRTDSSSPMFVDTNRTEENDIDCGDLSDLPTLTADFPRQLTQSSLLSSSTSSLYSTGLATPVSNPTNGRAELRRALGVPILNLEDLTSNNYNNSSRDTT